MDMPPPEDATIDNGGRLSGIDLCNYMENYTKAFLMGKAKFQMESEVLNIVRNKKGKWRITIEDLRLGSSSVLTFSRIILSTGVRSVTFNFLDFALTIHGCLTSGM